MAPRTKPRLTHAHLLELYRQMRLIRRFEEACAELYGAGKIRGFLHLYVGEEANAVGVMQALGAADAVVATYREHGHALARGLPTAEVMAEMFGRVGGSSRGRGGSMHIFDAGRRFYGGNAIVAGGLPVAVGLALADRMQGRSAVTCCFFGDGAVAEGEFHESLNLAALWQLPVLFVCENNYYGMGTRLELAESEPDLCRHAASYRIPAEAVDGMDVVAVEAAASRVVAEIRAGGGPRFLENRTYRFRAHSMFDAELYRDKAEVEQARHRDPIPRFLDWLAQNHLVHDAEIQAIDARVEAEIAEAIAFAEASEWEPVESLMEGVMAPAGAAP